MNQQLNLYVIDDDPVFKLIARKLLERYSIISSLFFYSNGEEGIHAVRQSLETGKSVPNIILLDIEMPVMDGWEFMNEYIKINSSLRDDIEIHIVSSSISENDRRIAASYAEIKSFIVKPLTIETINKILHTEPA